MSFKLTALTTTNDKKGLVNR